jgi:hypothetical protein
MFSISNRRGRAGKRTFISAIRMCSSIVTRGGQIVHLLIWILSFFCNKRFHSKPTFCCFPRSKEARHIYRRYEPIKINERPNGFRDELIHPRPSQLRFVSGLCWTNPNWLERKARAGSPKLAQPMRPSRLVRLQQKNQTVWLTKLPSNKDNHT